MDVKHNSDEVSVALPAPTAWPLVLALGLSLIAAGLVTSASIGLLGLVLLVAGGIGWFFQVLPHEHHVLVPIEPEGAPEYVSSRARPPLVSSGEGHRTMLPAETFKMSTGIKGGICGGIAMTLPAALFGILKHHSIWYTANLLAAGGFVSWAGASDAFLSQFHWQGLLAAAAIHAFVSLLVGLLYGATLPIYPKYPILTAGAFVPFLMTGILHSAIVIISPILAERIDWFWFAVSQIAFGLVCGFVVNLHARVRTPQFQALPFAVRAGVHNSPLPHATHASRKDELSK